MSTNKLRVLALMHRHLVPPDTIEEGTDITAAPWRTEYDVVSTLTGMGHEVRPLPVHDNLGDIRRAVEEWKPHIAFNLLEGFDDIVIFDQNVVSHLELLKLSYTGCNPRGLLLARDKSLSKKLLAFHRIPVPEFEVFRIGRPVKLSKRQVDPLRRLKKTLREHYRGKREHYGLDHPDFYESDLLNLFSDAPQYARNLSAARFVRRIRREVRGTVASFTDSYQYTIDQLLEKIIERCRELNLRLTDSEASTKIDFMVFLTVQTMNYLHSGRHRVAL